jgi:hypothetical protein
VTPHLRQVGPYFVWKREAANLVLLKLETGILLNAIAAMLKAAPDGFQGPTLTCAANLLNVSCCKDRIESTTPTKFGTDFETLSYEIRFREKAGSSWLESENITSTIGDQNISAALGLTFSEKWRSKRFRIGFDSIVSMHCEITCTSR